MATMTFEQVLDSILAGGVDHADLRVRMTSKGLLVTAHDSTYVVNGNQLTPMVRATQAVKPEPQQIGVAGIDASGQRWERW